MRYLLPTGLSMRNRTPPKLKLVYYIMAAAAFGVFMGITTTLQSSVLASEIRSSPFKILGPLLLVLSLSLLLCAGLYYWYLIVYKRHELERWQQNQIQVAVGRVLNETNLVTSQSSVSLATQQQQTVDRAPPVEPEEPSTSYTREDTDSCRGNASPIKPPPYSEIDTGYSLGPISAHDNPMGASAVFTVLPVNYVNPPPYNVAANPSTGECS